MLRTGNDTEYSHRAFVRCLMNNANDQSTFMLMLCKNNSIFMANYQHRRHIDHENSPRFFLTIWENHFSSHTQSSSFSFFNASVASFSCTSNWNCTAIERNQSWCLSKKKKVLQLTVAICCDHGMTTHVGGFIFPSFLLANETAAADVPLEHMS